MKTRVKEYFSVTFAFTTSLKSAYEGRWPFLPVFKIRLYLFSFIKMKKILVTVSGLLYRQIKHKNLTVNHRNKGK